MDQRPPSLRTIALTLTIAAATAAIGAFLFAWSGLYNVAASRDHWQVTRKFLEFGLRNSIETQSLGIKVPPLDDPNLVKLGAGHFASGCAVCHGAPGQPASAVFRHMLPSPPSLAEAVRHWDAAELFWIVQNGLKYTGMPAWPAAGRSDEVWAVVAYLRRLPELDAREYRDLANLPSGDPGEQSSSGVPALCIGCHGDTRSPPISRLVPKLDGLSASYIEFSLRSYRSGSRASGIMQSAASPLDDATIARIAAYYAALPRRAHIAGAAVQDGELGRRIAEGGLPRDGIPPCLSCHEGRARDIFPRLAGQHAPYIVNQLELWRSGLRRDTALGQIMAPIAQRLTPDQIRSVAAYLETRPPGALP